jgi:integrin beta 3
MLDTKALAEATALIVREHVDKATAPLIERIAVLESRAPKDGEPGKDGADGASVDPAEVERMIAEAVAKAVSEIPAPLDGKDGADGQAGKDGLHGEPGAKGADGKDGAGIGDLLIDRDGALVATFTDGRTKSLGVVVGKDGANGRNGAAGLDGLGFDDLAVEQNGERGFVLRFVQGERTKEFSFELPVVLDRGVWREGEYKAGDAVTWAGSLWIAQKDTDTKPDSGDGWRLSVKRGRDGKDKA